MDQFKDQVGGMLRISICIFIFSFITVLPTSAQTIPAGFPVLEEYLRREQLKGKIDKDFSFGSRPINPGKEFSSILEIGKDKDSTGPGIEFEKRKLDFKILPILSSTVYNNNRPFGWGNSGLKNGSGFQNLTSPGIYGKLLFLEIQLRPEFIFSQNMPYQGYIGGISEEIDVTRFRYWNYGDNPERFTEEYNSQAYWGQSYVSLNFGKVELGYSTQNIWWGPGQFTGLIFSNNAQGMKHFYLKTKQPADIFIGKLEGQLIAARADDSGVLPSQNENLNSIYAKPFSGDWRYINGLSLTFQPVFLPQFFIGFNRTFQQYNEDVGPDLADRFPVLQPFQKKKLFQDGNSVAYDTLGQDQQVSVFFRYLNQKANFEIYVEFGRRDHSFDWREFILNPEHARAYLMGFSKLFKTGVTEKYIQVRAEVIHQQESVNRYIRYPDELVASSTSWHTHYQVRGFTNYGEAMGVGIGVGGNAQILEISQVKNLNKVGFLIQRLENQQDFFYRAYGQDPKKKPWVDFSLGFIWEQQWNRFVLSANAQIINGVNYQWQTGLTSTADFPSSGNHVSFNSTINLIYQIGK